MALHPVRRLVGVAAATAALVLAPAVPSNAVPPDHFEFSFAGTVADSGEACGDPLSWDFVGDVKGTDFFDQDGNLVRTHLHIYESGTLSNLATGEVIELPRTAFLAQQLWGGGGTVTVKQAGLTVRISGPEHFFMEVGRFVTTVNPNQVLHSAGMQAIRENGPFSSTDPVQLRAFYGILD